MHLCFGAILCFTEICCFTFCVLIYCHVTFLQQDINKVIRNYIALAQCTLSRDELSTSLHTGSVLGFCNRDKVLLEIERQ